MFFYVQVGTVTALALWDPGAEVTLMKTSIFNQVKKDALGPVNPAPVGLSQACGAPVKDVKQTHFKLNIAGRVGLSSVFICPSTAHDMIIGMPDINRFHISYCSWERKLIFPGQANLKIKTSKVIKGGEMANVECQIFQANYMDCGRAFTTTKPHQSPTLHTSTAAGSNNVVAAGHQRCQTSTGYFSRALNLGPDSG